MLGLGEIKDLGINKMLSRKQKVKSFHQNYTAIFFKIAIVLPLLFKKLQIHKKLKQHRYSIKL